MAIHSFFILSFCIIMTKKCTFVSDYFELSLMVRPITTLGRYLMLMGRIFSKPERFRVYFKQYINEMTQLGIDSIGIVLLISFFIGAVICIQIK